MILNTISTPCLDVLSDINSGHISLIRIVDTQKVASCPCEGLGFILFTKWYISEKCTIKKIVVQVTDPEEKTHVVLESTVKEKIMSPFIALPLRIEKFPVTVPGMYSFQASLYVKKQRFDSQSAPLLVVESLGQTQAEKKQTPK